MEFRRRNKELKMDDDVGYLAGEAVTGANSVCVLDDDEAEIRTLEALKLTSVMTSSRL